MAKIEPVPEGYDEVEAANFVKFEKIGDTVSGKLIDKGRSSQFNFGLYTVLTDKDEQLRFHGTIQLDDLLLVIQLNDFIHVEFVDVEKTPKGEMKLFKVH